MVNTFRCQPVADAKNQNEQATLVDGTPITLRPIKPEDEPLWHELLAGTSRESLWARFQFAFKTNIHEAAIRFCFVDYDRELTVVAEANIAGARRLLGVARAVNDVNCGRAEFGIPWKGKGLGNLLTGYCLKNVDRTQVREIYAVTGCTNTRMIGVFRRFGFDIGPADDPALLLATKSIACDLRWSLETKRAGRGGQFPSLCPQALRVYPETKTRDLQNPLMLASHVRFAVSRGSGSNRAVACNQNAAKSRC